VKKAAVPEDEDKRLATLRGLKVLDTPREERFDRLTRMARRMFRVPIAAISLVDAERQWFKSCMGLAAREVPREHSFCAHAILSDRLMVVNDSLADERFADNPLVTGEPRVRFYAGYPVKATNGCRLGTLAIIDHDPRGLNEEEREILRDLAAMVERELNLQPPDTLDTFTGITNRRGFLHMAQRCLSLCSRRDIPASLILFALERPTLGTTAPELADNDLVVMTFAETMKHSFRESDVFARLDHNTFALLLTHTRTEGAARCAQRFLARLAIENHSLPPDERVSCHWQVVAFDASRHNTVDALLNEASRHLRQQRRQHH
jgi:diguanylate cyclase (GGDEF)-like protein